MITDGKLKELCKPSYIYTAACISGFLIDVPSYSSFDYGKAVVHIPRTLYSVIDEYVECAVIDSVRRVLDEIEPTIREEERNKLIEELRRK